MLTKASHMLNTVVTMTAIYARVSTDEQADNESLQTQVTRSLDFAKRIELTVPESHILREDESGTKIDRPKLNVLREWIRSGTINALIVYSSDRLSRNPAHAEWLYDELLENNVRLFIVLHGREFNLANPGDRQMLLMESGFNRQWRHMLLEAMYRGKRGKAERGLYIGNGHAPFGYSKEKEGRDTALVINAEEAEIVKSIYQWYLIEHVSVFNIVRRLRGTPTPSERKATMGGARAKRIRKPGEWNTTMIYEILHGELYCGRFTMFQSTDEPVTITIPPIVSRDQWEKAQQQLSEGRKLSRRGETYPYLMGRRLRCSICGYSVRAAPSHNYVNGKRHTYRYYFCRSRDNKIAHPNCGLPHFRVEIIDEATWEFVTDLISRPETLRLRLEESQQELEQRNTSLRLRVGQIDAALKRQEAKVDMLLEEFSEIKSEKVRAMFRKLTEETEQVFAELSAERDGLIAELDANTISDQYISEWEAFACTMRKRMETATYETRREIIDGLNLRGTLAVEDGVKVIYLHLYAYTQRVSLEHLGPEQEYSGSR